MQRLFLTMAYICTYVRNTTWHKQMTKMWKTKLFQGSRYRHKSNFCAGVKAPWIARKRGRTCESRADFRKAEILAIHKFGLKFLFGFGNHKCSSVAGTLQCWMLVLLCHLESGWLKRTRHGLQPGNLYLRCLLQWRYQPTDTPNHIACHASTASPASPASGSAYSSPNYTQNIMSQDMLEDELPTHHLKHGWRQIIRLNLYFKLICWYYLIFEYIWWMNILASNCPWLIRRATRPLTMVITTWQVKRAEVKPRTHRRFGVFEYVWSVPVDIRLFLVERDRQCVDTAWWLQRWHALLLRCYCVACVLEQKLDLTAGKDL